MHDYEWGANGFNAIHSCITYLIVMFICITCFYPFLWATMQITGHGGLLSKILFAEYNPKIVWFTLISYFLLVLVHYHQVFIY